MNQHHRPSSNGRGFTLIEVLVALALLGTALAVVMQIFSRDLKSIADVEDYMRASIKADSVMREVLGSDELEEGSWVESEGDGYDIDVSVKEIDEERTEDLSFRLLQVILQVRWMRDDKEREMSLMTVKLVQKIT